MRKVYWWREGCEGWTTPNFGDELVPLILEMAHVQQFEWASPQNSSDFDDGFVIAGSILEHLPRAWQGTVCGAGKLHGDTFTDLSQARVLGVRGHLTLDRLNLGSRTNYRDIVLGDPALLVPSWIRQYWGRWDLGIVPHWSDTELRKRYPYARFIDVRRPPQEVVEEIAKCKRIISSSLHGLVVADAYGIPRRAELFPDADARKHQEGGRFKFDDYASIYDDGDIHFGELWTAPHERVHEIQVSLRRMLATATQTAPPPTITPVPTPSPQKWPCNWWGGPQTSLLVPFRDDDEYRTRVWTWLKRYWMDHLASVEVIMGHDTGVPFSKAVAVNDAATRARGRVFVILDADAYLDTHYVQRYIDEIDMSVKEGIRQWYIPYDKLYRLSEAATLDLLETSPALEYNFPSPPPPNILDTSPLSAHDHNSVHYGHQYGALIQMLPREAFYMVGGMDPRFRGWGSEDAAFMHSVDTMYCNHELGTNDALHLWHARSGMSWDTRRWVGQPDVVANSRLAQRYGMAKSEAGWMRALTQEHAHPRNLRHRWRWPT
jgi:hypothetical protein